MNFYTDIQTIEMFNVIFILIKPHFPNTVYWTAPAKHRVTSTKIKKHSVTKSSKKLAQRGEFLLILMRLRLEILNEDLSDRFRISPALCSRTFTTWIWLLRQLLGHAIVVWLPREAIRQNLSKVFRKEGYLNCVILDCAEVFIERSKSLDNQAYKWSDYRHHITIKFLVGISPKNGFITFLSDCYGGRVSDKYVTKNWLEQTGFQIKGELLLHFCSLEIPPGARLKSQMTSAEVKKNQRCG